MHIIAMNTVIQTNVESLVLDIKIKLIITFSFDFISK